MNKENMLKVADFIEKESANETYHFNMRHWFYVGDRDSLPAETLVKGDFCGTSACIGGTADMLRALESKEIDIGTGISSSSGRAKDWLGLNYEEMRNLFYCDRLRTQLSLTDGGGYNYVNERRHLVPDALRYMVHTGTVDWLTALNKAEEARACRRERSEA